MIGVNRVSIMGRLGRDAEGKQTPNGSHYADLSLAVERYDYKTKEIKTDWVDVKLWGREGVYQYLVKGKAVYLEGRVGKRSWEANGQKHTRTEVLCNEVQLLGERQQQQPAGESSSGAEAHGGITDDDIPF